MTTQRTKSDDEFTASEISDPAHDLGLVQEKKPTPISTVNTHYMDVQVGRMTQPLRRPQDSDPSPLNDDTHAAT